MFRLFSITEIIGTVNYLTFISIKMMVSHKEFLIILKYITLMNFIFSELKK